MHLACVENNDPISPVTLERIGAQVAKLDATLETVENSGLAYINNVPFQFHFTSGNKFLSIRAVWESGMELDAPQVPNLFTAADSWNREKYFPTVYLVAVDGQMQVVADFIVAIGEGLDDAQLLENISAAAATAVEALQFMAQVVATLKNL
ncbi:YbjN domain-containing protein [Gleimia sp. 6138-11-ORH1]|uniref:YbjN domain-containing protein n=1 Tax=Gleimia sp. 6138-11-ORH1 TaxID=2973937 RepID=UPI002166DF29|nr:YbjN domain-containing protein [Gleimia sp. 6138-11-ORH1]MCS4484724.1 YbjN domain-containing protein [Gleimia sp. 6138-11-ORH1]